MPEVRDVKVFAKMFSFKDFDFGERRVNCERMDVSMWSGLLWTYTTALPYITYWVKAVMPTWPTLVMVLCTVLLVISSLAEQCQIIS